MASLIFVLNLRNSTSDGNPGLYGFQTVAFGGGGGLILFCFGRRHILAV